MDRPEAHFVEWIVDGFYFYKNHFWLLVLASLVGGVLSVVTLGILIGPMWAGLAMIVLRLIDHSKPTPRVMDIFQGFQYFLPSLLFVLVWGILVVVGNAILGVIPIIGWLAGAVLSLVVQALLMFGIFLIVDEDMDFWPASMMSMRVVQLHLWPLLALSIVASLIGGAGVILLGVGVVLTIPIETCILAASYREVFRKKLE